MSIALILNNCDKFELNAFHTSLWHIFGAAMNAYSYLLSFLYVPGHAKSYEIIHFLDLQLLLSIILCHCNDRFQGQQKKNVRQSCQLSFNYVAAKCHSYTITSFFDRPFLLESRVPTAVISFSNK